MYGRMRGVIATIIPVPSLLVERVGVVNSGNLRITSHRSHQKAENWRTVRF